MTPRRCLRNTWEWPPQHLSLGTEVPPARWGAKQGITLIKQESLYQSNVCRVCVNVAPENTAAVAFYAKFGATSFSQFWMVWDDIRTIHPPADSGQQSPHRD